VQELDETQYWLELISEAAIIPAKRLMPLQQERRIDRNPGDYH